MKGNMILAVEWTIYAVKKEPKKKKKNLRPDRESQPDRRNAQSIELINPTGEQAIVSS